MFILEKQILKAQEKRRNDLDRRRAWAPILESEREKNIRQMRTAYMKKWRAGQRTMEEFRKKQKSADFRRKLAAHQRQIMKRVMGLGGTPKPVCSNGVIYLSLNAAARALQQEGFHVTKTNVKNAIVHGWTCGGRRWEWASVPPVIASSRCCIEVETRTTHKSIAEAARALGVTRRAVASVIDKIDRTCRGRHIISGRRG